MNCSDPKTLYKITGPMQTKSNKIGQHKKILISLLDWVTFDPYYDSFISWRLCPHGFLDFLYNF